jgi:dienelactone hydrolase
MSNRNSQRFSFLRPRWKVVGWLAIALVVLVSLAVLVSSDQFWIRSKEVRIVAGDITLDATLALPRWKNGPYPGVSIVHGSAPTTKHELRGYARLFVPWGMAVLIYDKRGVGGSTGQYQEVTVPDSDRLLRQLADDVYAAVSFLSTCPDIDTRKIGLIGASQAGWIMPLAAARDSLIGFFISISGPAVSYGQEMFYSQLTGDDAGPYKNLSQEEIDSRFAAFRGPHGFDPMPTLQSLTIPSLWLLGGRDRSIPSSLSVSNLRLLDQAHPGRFTIRVFPACDHNLVDIDTGHRVDIWPGVREWLREIEILD